MESVAATAGHPGGLVGHVGSGVARFGGVLVNWGLPIAFFLLGYTFKDPIGLEQIVKGFLPPIATGRTVFGWPSGIITAIIYAGLGFALWMFLPFIGRFVGAFLMGSSLNLLLSSIRTDRTAAFVPDPNAAGLKSVATGG